MSERTPTPWSLFGDDMIVSGHDIVCRIPNHPENGQNWDADAAFIVKAANSHDRLVQAVTSAKRLIGAINDTASEAVKESNINTAWHILDDALASIKEKS